MKKLGYILFVMTMSITPCFGQWPTTDSSFALVWGDEFNNTASYNGCSFDTAKWLGRPTWNVGGTTYNMGAPHGYVDVPGYNFDLTDTSNIHVINGTCRLIARKETFISHVWDFSTPPYYFVDTFNYSNGALTSRRSLRFGYYEIRFRLPGNVTVPSSYNAYQPTFWMFGRNATAYHSEIDIFEIRGTNNELTNGGYFRTPNDYIPPSGWHDPDADTVTNGVWHTAAVNWDQNKIDYYYDGEYKRTHTYYADSLQEMSIFIEAMLPLFLGTNIPIDPTNTIFPYAYELDYVRVYQRKEACDSSKTYLTTTASAFKSKLYQNLTLGGSGGNASFNNGKASALGTEYVLLNEATTIDSNMEMYIDVIECNPNISVPSNFTIAPPDDNYNYRISRP